MARKMGRIPPEVVPYLPDLLELLQDFVPRYGPAAESTYALLADVFGVHPDTLMRFAIKERKARALADTNGTAGHRDGDPATGNISGTNDGRGGAEAGPGDDDSGPAERREIAVGSMVLHEIQLPDDVLLG